MTSERGSDRATVRAPGITMEPGVVIEARWMSSTSLRRASAQWVTTSRSTLSPGCRMRSRKAMRAAPSGVAEPAVQAPIASGTWSTSVPRSTTSAAIRLERAAKSSITVMMRASCGQRSSCPSSEFFRAAGVAEIGIGEERVERRPAADETLLVGIAQHRLEVLAVGQGQAVGPRVAAEDRLLLLHGGTHPGERDHARIGDASVGDLLGGLERLHQVGGHPRVLVHDLLPDRGDVHDGEDAG